MMKRLLAHLSHPAWQAIGVFATLVTVAFTVWYANYQSRRELSYQVDAQTPLVSVAPEARDDIQVFFQGKQVTNVYLSTVTLYNSGGANISSTDFDRNTPIEFDFGSEAEILSASVFNTIPNGLPVDLRIQGTSILINLVLLNVGGKIQFKIVTVGASDQIIVRSSINGINEIRKAESGRISNIILLFIGVIIGLLGNILVNFILMAFRDHKRSKNIVFREDYKKKPVWILAYGK